MRSRLLIGLAVLLALISAGVSAYWYVLTQRLSDGFAAWTQAQRAAGWTIQAGEPSFAGWPVTARLVVPGFRIIGGEAEIPGGISWGTERLMLDLDLRHPVALVLRAVGPQSVGGAQAAGFHYTAQVMRATLSLDHPDAPAAVRARMVRAGQNGLAIGAIDALIKLNATASPDQTAVAVTLTAGSVALPSGVNWPLGPHITSLTTESALSGPGPPPADPAREAQAWRDAGGALRVHALELRWGPLDAKLTATVSLDRSLQLTAEGRVLASNYAPTLDALAAHRVMGNDAALAAKAVLSLLARAPTAGGSPQVEVPFTVRDSTVAAGGIPLMKLPELQWPGAP